MSKNIKKTKTVYCNFCKKYYKNIINSEYKLKNQLNIIENIKKQIELDIIYENISLIQEIKLLE